ncbi:MAG: hypothetical protein KDB01_08120 [Planctomycetaceae bacterium]|nr:hypothetical protein [Planctomycetaceae bacterium]
MKTIEAAMAEVIVIGRDDGHTFRELWRVLRQNPHLHLNGEFLTPGHALRAGLGETLQADFVIVLQTWSDEFAPQEITELIGRLLFGRILCCYGPWCTADGRSHDLWPVTFRVPAASAPAVMEQELADFRENIQPLFPMSAGEEVFAHRSRVASIRENAVRRRVLVISDDFELRKTTARILAALNCDPAALPLSRDKIRQYLKSSYNSTEMAILDLDGPTGEVLAGLEVLHASQSQPAGSHIQDGTEGNESLTLEAGPRGNIMLSSRPFNDERSSKAEAGVKNIIGMSVFAASLVTTEITSSSPVSRVIEKTELLFELRGLLNNFSC